jgi:hypothetical protein
MSKKYKLLKDINCPMGVCKAGTISVSEKDPNGFLAFPYEGKTYNQHDFNRVGNAFCVAGELDPEWFEEVEE